MGFRQNSYATVWGVEPVSDTRTKVRLSISRKNQQTGQYDQDFGDFVSFVGTACARKAALLKPKDRIKLGDVDVRNRYDAEKKVTYYYPTVFSFEPADGGAAKPAQTSSVDDGEPDIPDERLPF